MPPFFTLPVTDGEMGIGSSPQRIPTERLASGTSREREIGRNFLAAQGFTCYVSFPEKGRIFDSFWESNGIFDAVQDNSNPRAQMILLLSGICATAGYGRRVATRCEEVLNEL